MALLPLLTSATRKRALVACLLITGLAVATTGPILADEDSHDARHPEDGEAAPLQGLLARIRHDFAATVLQVELESETAAGERRWVYEAKVVTPEGDVLKLEYDARTLELLALKGRHERPRDNGDD